MSLRYGESSGVPSSFRRFAAPATRSPARDAASAPSANAAARARRRGGFSPAGSRSPSAPSSPAGRSTGRSSRTSRNRPACSPTANASRCCRSHTSNRCDRSWRASTSGSSSHRSAGRRHTCRRRRGGGGKKRRDGLCRTAGTGSTRRARSPGMRSCSCARVAGTAAWRPYLEGLIAAAPSGSRSPPSLSLLLARRIARPLQRVVEASRAARRRRRTRRDPRRRRRRARLARRVVQPHGERARARARAAERAFLLSVSHELKTPLTAILGYAEGLADGAIDATRRRPRSRRKVLDSTGSSGTSSISHG